ncbi:MFS transporter [Kibdelosporangium philippinense]|uniref:MFS transporter n=1 Tax=Kibdelosporangium philippinense TaxID=211113 RepID=A0ABS8Z2G9_9PSEU|nr:MFS transporter [Kibdelosporangium philippinense]MCE7002045.1 MFS transporter [Kibdelosporangium philippinense]
MSADERPDLDSIINRARTSRFQTLVIALCVAVVVLDGFDTLAISFAAPGIAAAWHISPSSFGFVFGIGLFGGLVGAICTGVVADRIGRKPTLVITTLLFGVVSFATPLADSMTSLSLIRFVTGLGVGGALPGAIAIATEYAPKRARAGVAAVTFCGLPLGAALGSVLAAYLIPRYGWESIFIVGGVLPLLLVPFIVVLVPESIGFLSLRGDVGAIAKLLARMGVDEEERANVEIRPEIGPRCPSVWSLFTEGRALGTALLSAAVFLTLLMASLLVNWIPTLAIRAGIGTSAAILAAASLNIGGILGSLVISKLSGRWAPGVVVSLSYALGAVTIACVGQVGTSGSWLLGSAFVAGFLAIGAQMCTISLVATYYDTRLRATGVGWAIGCGRVGGILGPVIGGWLIGASVSMGAIFVIAGLVCVACAVTVFAIGRLVPYAPADR